MELYNTKTRKIEKFKPINDREIKIYYCGPTVYNYAHIGNLRTFVFEDVVVKALKFIGYKVKTTMNITDVDDKTIRNSVAAGIDLKTFTEKYTKIFLSDINKLGIEKADNIAAVTTLIPEMVRMINTMIKRKNAYLSDDGSIYFNIKTSRKYGRLANLDMKGLKEGVRVDNDEYEKDAASDFVLWKAWKDTDGDNFWEEEFEVDGKKVTIKGRPGWHIECSACNMKFFGPQIDIHMGGVDLIFPHHQNEIAQTEACTRKEFSRYWLHSGHVMVDHKKMSKSANNFYTLNDIEEKFSDTNKSVLFRAIRLGFVNAKYSSQIDFSFSKLEANINAINAIDETLKRLSREIDIGDKKVGGISRDFRNFIQEIMQEYVNNLEDDFNLPEALAVFHSFLKFLNTGISGQELSLEELISAKDMLNTLNQVLGIIDFTILNENDIIPDDIIKKSQERNDAKKSKNFELADAIRDELLELGYKIVDERGGSRIEKS
ncbi:MAG: cysteine--tRNA ligase [Candidatus Gracilibacteria bacterium]